MFLALTISNITPTRGTRTNPKDALRAGRRVVLAEDLAAVAAADFARDLVKCIQLSVPNVAKTLKCLSFPEATGLYTAAIVSASSPPAVLAGHIGNRVERFGRVYT